MRVGPRYGADQHDGHRGVGGSVGANAAALRIGARSDMPQVTVPRAESMRQKFSEVHSADQSRERRSERCATAALPRESSLARHAK